MNPPQILMEPAFVDFMAYPSRLMHRSWRTVLFKYPIGDNVWSVPAAHKHLSQHVRRTLDLNDVSMLDVASLSWAVATLRSAKLDSFIRHVGAVALRAEICGVIDRKSMHTVIDQIGRELYEFTLQRGSLICPVVVDAVELLGTRVDFNAIDLQLQTAGRLITQHYLDRHDPALWARAQLKLEWMAPEPARASAMPLADATISRIVSGVKREMQ